MTKLSFGKSIEITAAKCDFCHEEIKQCAQIMRVIWERETGKLVKTIEDYDFDYSFFGGEKRVIKGEMEYQFVEGKLVEKEIPFDVCGDCAKQIADELVPKKK